jgi:hypothetical protein
MFIYLQSDGFLFVSAALHILPFSTKIKEGSGVSESAISALNWRN